MRFGWERASATFIHINTLHSWSVDFLTLTLLLSTSYFWIRHNMANREVDIDRESRRWLVRLFPLSNLRRRCSNLGSRNRSENLVFLISFRSRRLNRKATFVWDGEILPVVMRWQNVFMALAAQHNWFFVWTSQISKLVLISNSLFRL